MKLDNIRTWRYFAYSLYYPGLLGSMIYDALSSAKGVMESNLSGAEPWELAAKIVVLLIYTLDALHLEHDLQTTHSKKSGRHILFDCGIATFLTLASLLVGAFDTYIPSAGFLVLASFLYCCYPDPNKKEDSPFRFGGWYVSGAIIFFMSSLLNLFASVLSDLLSSSIQYLQPLTALMVFASYALHVFYFMERDRKPKLGGGAAETS